MPQSEFLEWVEYARVEPFGSHVEDLRAGVVAAAIYNVQRDPEACPDPLMPLMFIPWNAATQTDEPAQRRVIGDDLTPDQLSALIDARMFGRTPS